MMWKIDLEKAYDMVSWDFIRDTLKEVGLNSDWIRNIMASCIRYMFMVDMEGGGTEEFLRGKS